MQTPDSLPRSCKDEPTDRVPLIDRNRCEAKAECSVVCPFQVFHIRPLTPEERAGVSLRGRLNLWAHGGRQAVVASPERCHACGLCVAACPEKAIRLVPRGAG